MWCAIALVLLMDGSGSMNHHWATQREQTAAALENPIVIDAVERQAPVALLVGQFSTFMRVEVPWVLMHTAEDVRNVAARIRSIQFMDGPDTNIGPALMAAQAELAAAPCEADQQIIDLSTDGISQEGPMEVARDRAQEAGIRINVIGVELDERWEESLRNSAVTSDGFMLVARTWDDYPRLFRRKIILELTERL
jgi:Ca-activated chloride channel family protein